MSTVHLALNENPYGPLPSVQQALRDGLTTTNRYPEFLPRRLEGLVANRLGVDVDRILVGCGATGVIMHILQELVIPGSRVIMAYPTFEGYPIMTSTVGGVIVGVPLAADGSQDLVAMAQAVNDRTSLVVLCSPHNPTGTRLRSNDVETILRQVGSEIPVVLDEAYAEFVPADERLDTATLLSRHPNLIAVRTFSKAFGLAALRIGYAVGSPDTIAAVRRWQVPFGMNALAEIGVRACYEAEGEMGDRVAAITAERDRLHAGLRDLGFHVPTSSANCLFLAGDRVGVAFEAANIRVKHYPSGVRITVGDGAATDAVLEAAGRTTVQY